MSLRHRLANLKRRAAELGAGVCRACSPLPLIQRITADGDIVDITGEPVTLPERCASCDEPIAVVLIGEPLPDDDLDTTPQTESPAP